MSLDSTLRGLAAEIGQSRTVTGSVAAPAKLRHRTGSITAYTAGDLTASVQIGGDIVDAPFVATYNPTVGDTVSVLINNGSPLVLGPVNRTPITGGLAIIGQGQFHASDLSGYPAGSVYGVPFDVNDASDAGIWQVSATPTYLDTLVVGWFVASAFVGIAGATAGDTFRMKLYTAGGENLAGIEYSIADASGNADMSAQGVISYRSVAPIATYHVTVEQIAGTGTGAFLTAAYIYLNLLSGETL